MSRYGIKAVFNTLQGEGSRAGWRSVFVRMTGCNLWDGHPLHRDSGAGPCARWCDTDFFKGTPMSLEELLASMDAAWPLSEAIPSGYRWGDIVSPKEGVRWCVLTGGEPTLQINDELVEGLHKAGWCVAVETNGTVECPALERCDHVCLSPKLGTRVVLRRADEIKVVLPGAADGAPGWTDAELLKFAASGSWRRKFVQAQDIPLDPSLVDITLLKGNCRDTDTVDLGQHIFGRHVERAVTFVMNNPSWSLSVQVHKLLGLE